jgi:6-phosphogluconolactonase
MERHLRMRILQGMAGLWPAVLLIGCGGGGGGGGGSTPPPPPPTYSIGGSVTGLSGTGLVLQNNSGGDLAIAASGNFVFADRLAAGAAYSVSVRTQPDAPSQTCAVSGGSGTLGSADVTNVTISCTTNSFTVGGTVTGLAGNGLTLSLNGGADLSVNGNGDFAFPNAIASGSSYEVRLGGAPSAPAQLCTLAGASGTVAAANIANVSVSCTTRYAQFALVTDQNSSTLSSFAVDGGSGRMSLRSVVGTEQGAVGVVANRAGDRVYVANQSSDEISAYELNRSTGLLTRVAGAPQAAGDAPQKVKLDPSGQFLVVPNLLSGDLSVYSVAASSGALAPVTGSPFLLSAAARPTDVAFDSTGRLHVTDLAADAVWVLALDAVTGALQVVQGSPFATGGDNPVEVEITQDGRFAVVVNSLSDNLSVLSIASNGALTPVPGSPFQAGGRPVSVSLEPSGRFLHVVNNASDNLYTFAVNRGTGALAEVSGGRVNTGDAPTGVESDPTGGWMFVTNATGSTLGSYRVDMNTGVPALQRSQAARRGPSALTLVSHTSPLDIRVRHAYVANHDSDDVSVLALDDATGALDVQGSPVMAGDGPLHIAVHPGGQFAYVVNLLADAIQAYNITSDGGLALNGAAVAGGDGTVRMVIEPSGRFAYVANINAGTISVFDIDAVNGQLTARSTAVPVGPHLQSLAMDPAGLYLYAGTLLTPQIHVFRIDFSSGGLTAVGTPVGLTGDAFAMSIDASGTRLHVASVQASTVTAYAINRSTGGVAIIGTPVGIGTPPRALVARPAAAEVFTANYSADTLSRLLAGNTGALTLSASVAGRDGPVDIAIEGEGRYVFAVNLEHGTVTSHDVSQGGISEVDLATAGTHPIAIELLETLAP